MQVMRLHKCRGYPLHLAPYLKCANISNLDFRLLLFVGQHMSKKLTVEQIMQMQKNLFNTTGNFEGTLTLQEVKDLMSGNYNSEIVERFICKDGRVYRRERILL